MSERKVIQVYQDDYDAIHDVIEQLHAEIERLKAERKTLIENHEKHIIAVIEAWSGHG